MKTKKYSRLPKVPNLAFAFCKDLVELDPSFKALNLASTHPQSYLDLSTPDVDIASDEFKNRYLSHEIMSKYDAFALNIDREQVAKEGFVLNELKCLETNNRIAKFHHENIHGDLEAVIMTARAKIRSVLPPFRWAMLYEHLDFTNGASVGVKRADASRAVKARAPEVTQRLLPYANKALAFLGLNDVCCVTPHSRVEVVPKNSKTDRLIAIEPSMNMFFQRGIGSYMKRRLNMKPNVDLNDQRLNQVAALLASRNNDACTVDLKAASDTISFELVKLLLPPDWFEILDICRTPSVLMDGETHALNKFSAMGNGYTFELETLLFWALAQSCEDLCSTSFLVNQYGDDLVCSKAAYERIMSVFSYVGFTCNEKKTFIDGPFRESCGKHYHDGVDVSPFYIRRPITNCKELILLLNNFRKWCDSLDVWDLRYKAIYDKYAAFLPKYLRETRVPIEYWSQALVGPSFEHKIKQPALGQQLFYFVEQSKTHVAYRANSQDVPVWLWRKNFSNSALSLSITTKDTEHYKAKACIMFT